jgi:hypothetical protein
MQSKATGSSKRSGLAKCLDRGVAVVNEWRRALCELDRLRRRSIYLSRSLRLLMVPRLPDRGSVWRTTMIAQVETISRMPPTA